MSRSLAVIESLVAASLWADAVPNDPNRVDWEHLKGDVGLTGPEVSIFKNARFGSQGSMALPAPAPADLEVYVKFGKHSDAELLAVPSVQVDQILSSAQENFHSEGGILLREVQPGNFVKCTKDRVPNNSVLSFEPMFYNAKFKYKTLSGAKSLRLLAKQAAKTIGKVGGKASQVSGLLVEVEVHGVERARIEGFIDELQKSILIEGDIVRWINYGVLHGHFVVEPYDGIVRSDREDSYEHEDGASSEASLQYYS